MIIHDAVNIYPDGSSHRVTLVDGQEMPWFYKGKRLDEWAGDFLNYICLGGADVRYGKVISGKWSDFADAASHFGITFDMEATPEEIATEVGQEFLLLERRWSEAFTQYSRN